MPAPIAFGEVVVAGADAGAGAGVEGGARVLALRFCTGLVATGTLAWRGADMLRFPFSCPGVEADGGVPEDTCGEVVPLNPNRRVDSLLLGAPEGLRCIPLAAGAPEDDAFSAAAMEADEIPCSPWYCGGGFRDLPRVLLKKLRPADFPALSERGCSGLVDVPEATWTWLLVCLL